MNIDNEELATMLLRLREIAAEAEVAYGALEDGEAWKKACLKAEVDWTTEKYVAVEYLAERISDLRSRIELLEVQADRKRCMAILANRRVQKGRLRKALSDFGMSDQGIYEIEFERPYPANWLKAELLGDAP